MKFRRGRRRDQRQAPQPEQDEGDDVQRATSPAAVWGNPRAAPRGQVDADKGDEIARERQDED